MGKQQEHTEEIKRLIVGDRRVEYNLALQHIHSINLGTSRLSLAIRYKKVTTSFYYINASIGKAFNILCREEGVLVCIRKKYIDINKI